MAVTGDFQRNNSLFGTDEATIDEKGRILLPVKKRLKLCDKFVLAVGNVECLIAYPESVWYSLVSEILSYDGINAGTEQYTRLLFGSAEIDMSFDSQGRFVIPQKLRDQAKIKKNALIVGCGNRLEIWSKEEHEEYSRDPENYRLDRREAFERAYRQMKGQ